MNRKNRHGFTPGTITIDVNAKPIITCIDYNKSILKESVLSIDNFKKLNVSTKDNRLIIIYDYKSDELMQLIKNKYSIHSLSLEDITNTDQRSKYDSYENYEFYIINRYDRLNGLTDKRQISIILTNANTVILFIEGKDEEYSIQPIIEQIKKDKGRIRERDTGYTSYALIDAIMDTYFIILEEIDSEMEMLDERISNEQSTSMVKDLFNIKRETLQIKKNTWPLREMINSMQRDENSLLFKDVRNIVFIKDLQDHVYNITEMSDNMRDRAYSLVEMHTNFVGMRMNEIMKVLTIITTIFVPIMFLASIYGMNFDDIPEIHIKHGYPIFWGVVTILTFIQWYFFKKKKWL